MKSYAIVLTLLLIMIVPSGVCASGSDSSKVTDTVLFTPGVLFLDTSPATDGRNFEERLTQNPTAALFKSMAVPGWGQAGNRKYVKALIFAGLDAWMIGSAIHYGRDAADFRDKWESATTVDQRNDYYGLYEDHKGDRNKFTWFAVIVTFIGMFDAYVDAHLSGYPSVEKEPVVGWELVPGENQGVQFAVSLSF